MTTMPRYVILVSFLFLAGCGGEEVAEISPPPDRFLFDSGGAHHLEGYGAWRVTASRDGPFRAVHDVRGEETVYDEVVLEPPARAIFWSAVDRAGLDALRAVDRPGVPDETRLTFRLEKGAGETFETTIWQNDVRGRTNLEVLLQELKIRIEETYGVRPVF